MKYVILKNAYDLDFPTVLFAQPSAHKACLDNALYGTHTTRNRRCAIRPARGNALQSHRGYFPREYRADLPAVVNFFQGTW